jgi:hypothetical protein
MCARDVAVTVFPAALAPSQPVLPEPVVSGQEAGCFSHPANRAVAACDTCGRFLCALCDIDDSSGHTCPACFQRAETPALHERVNYDSIALTLVTVPMLFCWLPVLTTPAALFFAFKFWNAPSPVFPRGRWRLWLTVLIAVAQIGIAVWLAVFLSQQGRGRLPSE